MSENTMDAAIKELEELREKLKMAEDALNKVSEFYVSETGIYRCMTDGRAIEIAKEALAVIRGGNGE